MQYVTGQVVEGDNFFDREPIWLGSGTGSKLTTCSLLEQGAAREDIEKPGVWTFRVTVETGHTSDAIAVLKHNGADQRWRPLYEALRAAEAGTADYLRRVAPEVRTVAAEILKEVAPQLATHEKRRPKKKR